MFPALAKRSLDGIISIQLAEKRVQSSIFELMFHNIRNSVNHTKSAGSGRCKQEGQIQFPRHRPLT